MAAPPEFAIQSVYNLSHAVTWDDMPSLLKDAFIKQHLDGFDYNASFKAAVLVAMIIVVLAGVPSNLMTVIIILFNKGAKTPTNYFLLNLAIVDIISLIFCKYIFEKLPFDWFLNQSLFSPA